MATKPIPTPEALGKADRRLFAQAKAARERAEAALDAADESLESILSAIAAAEALGGASDRQVSTLLRKAIDSGSVQAVSAAGRAFPAASFAASISDIDIMFRRAAGPRGSTRAERIAAGRQSPQRQSDLAEVAAYLRSAYAWTPSADALRQGVEAGPVVARALLPADPSEAAEALIDSAVLESNARLGESKLDMLSEHLALLSEIEGLAALRAPQRDKLGRALLRVVDERPGAAIAELLSSMPDEILVCLDSPRAALSVPEQTPIFERSDSAARAAASRSAKALIEGVSPSAYERALRSGDLNCAKALFDAGRDSIGRLLTLRQVHNPAALLRAKAQGRPVDGPLAAFPAIVAGSSDETELLAALAGADKPAAPSKLCAFWSEPIDPWAVIALGAAERGLRLSGTRGGAGPKDGDAIAEALDEMRRGAVFAVERLGADPAKGLAQIRSALDEWGQDSRLGLFGFDKPGAPVDAFCQEASLLSILAEPKASGPKRRL